MELSPVVHEPLHERVYQEITRSLMTGKIVPGDRLTVRSVAAALQVSPMPVRAAISRLVAKGAFSLMNGTAVVPPMTRRRFLELREVRIQVEGLAAEKAASGITSDELDRLAVLCEELTRATDAGDEALYLEKNRQLRFTIYHAARSQTLLDVIEMLWLQVGPFFIYVTRNLSTHHEIDHHFDALAALRARDGPAARRAIERDTLESGEHLLSFAEFSPE
jgi:DNA-binding GntR family transcriptional regulator